MKILGKCLCGSITIHCTNEPVKTVNCHCTMCRKVSGAAYSTFAMFLKNHVRVMGNSETHFSSSTLATRSFCSKCGSNTQFNYAGKHEYVYLPVGLFNSAVAIHPQENWYASTKLHWISDCNNLPEYEELPNG